MRKKLRSSGENEFGFTGLSRRYNLLIIPLILLAAVLSYGSSIWFRYRNAIVDAQKEQILNLSRTVARSLSIELQGYEDALRFFSSIQYEADAEEQEKVFLEQQDGRYVNFFREDRDGNVTYQADDLEMTAQLCIAKMSEETSVWQYHDAEDYHYLVLRKEMKSGACFCLAVDEEQLYTRLISGISVGKNGYVLIKNSDGIILMHPERKQWGIDVIEGRRDLYPDLDYSSLSELIRKQLTGEEGIADYYSYWWPQQQLTRQYHKISAYCPAEIGDDFWVVSSVIDYDELYAPAMLGFRRIAILFVASILAIIFFTIYTMKLLADRRRTNSEIRALKDVNSRLEEVHKGVEMLAHQERLQIMGTLTGSIAHEFNNFLTPIMGYSELLMMDLPRNSDNYDSAREIYEASQKAKDVVRQISALSRRNMETVFRSFDFGKQFSRISKMMESVLPPNIRLECDNQVEDASILGNTTQFNQVFLNLFANAVHAIGKKEGHISVRAVLLDRKDLPREEHPEKLRFGDAWQHFIRIQVQDNGCGIEEEVLPHIFDPFFTTKKAGEGSGLGLSVVDQIVESHRGAITVSSKVGEGTVFSLYFPVMDSSEKVAEAELISEHFAAPDIVVADGNMKVLAMLQKNFEKICVSIRSASVRSSLLSLLEEKPADVLVIGELADETDSLDLCMYLDGKYSEMMLVLMTDMPDDSIIEAKQKQIIDDYLIKPVSVPAILNVIRQHQK